MLPVLLVAEQHKRPRKEIVAKTSVRYNKYSKTIVIQQLNDAEAAVERSTKSYEERMADWKANSPANFARAVKAFSPDSPYGSNYFDINSFRPPERSPMCSDWRIQAMNKCILRITAMSEDTISLRSDDEVWSHVNLASCL